MTPARPPISNPPTLERTSIPSAGSGLFTSIAFFITATLFARASSSIPVPLPVTSSGRPFVITEVMALEGVVLPIPMSPVPTMSMPEANSSSNTSIPASIARIASFLVIAGPRAMFFVPKATFLFFTPFTAEATPISTTTTLAPTCLASTLIPAPPFRKLWTICGVTSLGKALTPSSVTPWSPAIVNMTLFFRTGFSLRVISTICFASSSSLPRDP